MQSIINLFIIIGLPLLFVASESPKNAVANRQCPADSPAVSSYCNSRFGFCVAYPVEMLPGRQVAENGDGVLLQTEDGDGLVKVNGSHNIFDWTPAELYAFNLDETARGEAKNLVVVSKLIGEDFYECRWLSGGKSIFQQVFFLEEKYVQLTIEVPANRPELLEALREHVRLDFLEAGI